jgi:hypothetical protein
MRRFALLGALVASSLWSAARDAAAQPAPPPKPAEPAQPVAPAQPAEPPQPDQRGASKSEEPGKIAPPAAAPPGAGASPPAAQPSQEQPPTRPQEPSPLPPEPPSTAPPPVQPMPQVPPLATPATSAPATVDVGPGSEGPPLPPPESSIGPEVFAGTNVRLNDIEGYRDAESAALAFGLGGWFAPNRSYSLGLSYRRTSLGTAMTAPGERSLSARYDLNTVWFGGRAFPWRNDQLGFFILLELGASWQNVSASGTRPSASFTVPAEGFACSATDRPGFALGGGAGLDVDIERQLAFIVEADISGHRLSSDPIDDCAPGAGAATNLGARIGFLYRFDLDPAAPRSSASAQLR